MAANPNRLTQKETARILCMGVPELLRQARAGLVPCHPRECLQADGTSVTRLVFLRDEITYYQQRVAYNAADRVAVSA